MHHTHLHKYAVPQNLVLTSLLRYTQNFAQSQCYWGIFIIIQVPANNRETSELPDTCLNAYIPNSSIKYTTVYLLSKFLCQIKHFGAWSMCFSLKHKASSQFFRFIYLFFFTSPAKRAPHKIQNRLKDRRLLLQLCRLLSMPLGRSWPPTPGMSRHFSLIHLHSFLFTRNNIENKNIL